MSYVVGLLRRSRRLFIALLKVMVPVLVLVRAGQTMLLQPDKSEDEILFS